MACKQTIDLNDSLTLSDDIENTEHCHMNDSFNLSFEVQQEVSNLNISLNLSAELNVAPDTTAESEKCKFQYLYFWRLLNLVTKHKVNSL